MKFHALGRSGLQVSELCLGAMTFGGKGFWKVVGELGDAAVERIAGGAPRQGRPEFLKERWCRGTSTSTQRI